MATGTVPNHQQIDRALSVLHLDEDEKRKKSPGAYSQDFTPAESACISDKIPTLIDEGEDQDKAVAIAISVCAPEKARSIASGEVAELSTTYRVTREGGVYRIHHLPIFSERNEDLGIGAAWLFTAVQNGRVRAHRGFLPPAHVDHHETMDSRERVGFFSNQTVGYARVDGKPMFVAFADVLIEGKDKLDVIARLPYRSAEIVDLSDPPTIDTVAFMETQTPFFRFPVMVLEQDKDSSIQTTVQSFKAPRFAVIGRKTRGRAAAVLCQFPAFTFQMDDAKPLEEGRFMATHSSEHDDKDKKKKEEEEKEKSGAGKPDVKSNGEEDLQELMVLMRAIAAKLGITPADEPEPPPSEEEKSPVADALSAALRSVKGDAPKSNGGDGQPAGGGPDVGGKAFVAAIAKLEGRVQGQDATIRKLENERTMSAKATAAVDKIRAANRHVVDDIEETALKFANLGDEALEGWTDEVIKYAGETPTDENDLAAGITSEDEDVAEYVNYGDNAVQAARVLANQWDNSSGAIKAACTRKKFIRGNIAHHVPELRSARGVGLRTV